MPFSILFETPEDRPYEITAKEPDFFGDLNLDQVVNDITAGRDEYDLKPFFYSSLHRIEAIVYRQEVMRDLEDARLFEFTNSFAEKMSEVRKSIARAEKRSYYQEKRLWFLDAVEIYCEALTAFADNLNKTDPASQGFLKFRDHLTTYLASDHFVSLSSETNDLAAELAAIRYTITIKREDGRFTVRRYESEPDYSVEIEKTFSKFQEGTAEDYRTKPRETADLGYGMNHIQGKILEFVARLHPDTFAHLDAFCIKNEAYVDELIATFDREVQFYLAYLRYITDIKKIGLRFCYPDISPKRKEVFALAGFDIALARKLAKESKAAVCNDFSLSGKERVLVVSGPNQGGKTTFARAFGQSHYLANMGIPVPGNEAQLYLFDNLFTHFEREEKVENLRGKLEDDLRRIHDILDHATSDSIIIMNEIFTSTTLQDEIFLSRKIMEAILEIDALCVWVTFIDELSSSGSQTVSMTSMINPKDPAIRTFKIIPRRADGLAYAMAIAHKYRLTYESIKERIK